MSSYAASDGRSPSTAAAVAAHASSAVSWAAIFAGALAAAVMSLLLFILGIGLGFSSVSVWSGQGGEASSLGVSAIVWLALTQLVSAGVGGYIAGRLRTKWAGSAHNDEIFFRDTAHGFLVWSLATLAMVCLMGSVVGGALVGTAKATGAVVSGAGSVVSSVAGVAAGTAASAAAAGVAGVAVDKVADGEGSDMAYRIHKLLRNGGPTTAQKEELQAEVQQVAQQARSAAEDAKEVTMIFAQALQTGELPEADVRYIASIVAQHSAITQDEAQQKVQDSFAEAKQQIEAAKVKLEEAKQEALQAAEEARKAAAHAMLWMFVVLMIGAFIASASATLGGRQREA